MSFLLGNWRLILIGLAATAVLGYVWTAERAKTQLAKSKAIAEQQNVQNAKQALADLKKKERSDETYDRSMARLRADLKRLRNARPSLLPASTAAAPSVDRACFSRPELDAALRRYRDGVLDLLGEGAAAVEGLDTAKDWARGL